MSQSDSKKISLSRLLDHLGQNWPDAAAKEGYRRSLEGWQVFAEDCPKILRDEGAVEVKRVASYRGVTHDPGLVGAEEIDDFFSIAENIEKVQAGRITNHVQRVVDTAMKIRAKEGWPEHVKLTLANLSAFKEAYNESGE